MLTERNKRRYFVRLVLLGALIASVMALRNNDYNVFWIVIVGLGYFYLDRQVKRDETD